MASPPAATASPSPPSARQRQRSGHCRSGRDRRGPSGGEAAPARRLPEHSLFDPPPPSPPSPSPASSRSETTSPVTAAEPPEGPQLRQREPISLSPTHLSAKRSPVILS